MTPKKILNLLRIGLEPELEVKPGPVARRCLPEEIEQLYGARCPICETATLLQGPRAGLCVNVKCSVCGSKWNITPIPACCELLSPPRTPRRLPML